MPSADDSRRSSSAGSCEVCGPRVSAECGRRRALPTIVPAPRRATPRRGIGRVGPLGSAWGKVAGHDVRMSTHPGFGHLRMIRAHAAPEYPQDVHKRHAGCSDSVLCSASRKVTSEVHVGAGGQRFYLGTDCRDSSSPRRFVICGRTIGPRSGALRAYVPSGA